MSEKSLHPRTRAVHHGIRRSQYGEMAEALEHGKGVLKVNRLDAPGTPTPAGYHGPMLPERSTRRAQKKNCRPAAPSCSQTA